MPDQSLFTAHGAQPPKPSRYKPIWTDRFFTGYYSNRNPFRSPLSAFYAQGWQLGKTDTLIDGLNVEISPRLTLIRRPGIVPFTNATLPQAPASFYPWHAADGEIALIADTPGALYNFSTTNVIDFYNKTSGAGPTRFCAIGNRLYFGDGTTCKSYDRDTSSVRQMGITAPIQKASAVSTPAAGTNATITGCQFSGAGYISTEFDAAPYESLTVEFLMKSSGTGADMPVASFENTQSGGSSQVYYDVFIDGGGGLNFSILDTSINNWVTTNAGNLGTFGINLLDNNWHHVSVQMTFAVDVTSSVSYAGGVPQALPQGAQQLPDTPSTTYSSAPSLSAAQAPAICQVFIYVDGKLILSSSPAVTSIGRLGGFWRIGNSSQIGTDFTGILAEVVTHNATLPGAASRWNALTVGGGLSVFEVAYADVPVQNWWKLSDSAAPFANSGVGDSGTGSTQGALTLNQSSSILYVPYANSASFSLGQRIVDSNGNIQQCTTAGTSGSTAPSWNKVQSQKTADNTITWTNIGPGSVILAAGTQYAYSYVNRYGHFSTLSALSDPVPPGAWVNRLWATPSTDPQVVAIAFFRFLDGGSTPFYIDSVPNKTTGGFTTYSDALPDIDLNILMAGPQAHANDPPPSGLTNLVYHLGRIWGTVGNFLYASGGPDTIVGTGLEAFPPSNFWQLPSYIVRLEATNSGLYVFTSSGVFLMAGGPGITQFYLQEPFKRIGLANWNALDSTASQIVFFTTDRQFLAFELGSQTLSDLGFPIQDQLANINPALATVAHHRAGLDNAVYLGDGQTGWYRCVPMQQPDYQITGPVWSPKAVVNGGHCGVLASLETAPGQYSLFVGDTRANQQIAARDSTYSTNSDYGLSYDAYATIGSIVLAQPGELAEISFITAEFNPVSLPPIVGVLMDEIDGGFSTISGYSVSDPPVLYGNTTGPASLMSNRYYLRQSINGANPGPAWCRHMQIKVDFRSQVTANEILSMTIFGTIMVEG